MGEKSNITCIFSLLSNFFFNFIDKGGTGCMNWVLKVFGDQRRELYILFNIFILRSTHLVHHFSNFF